MKLSRLKIKAFSRFIVLSGLVLMLTACASQTHQGLDANLLQSVNGDMVIPDNFGSKTQVSDADTPVFQLDTHSLLNGFDNPQLQALIQQGLNNSPNLAATATLVLDAQTRARSTNSQRLPDLNLSGTATRSKSNLGNVVMTGNNYSLGLNSQWELDIWLKLRDQSKASYLGLAASENDLVFAQLSLAANISRAYFNYLSEQELLEQITKSTANINSLEKIAVRSLKRGLVTALDVQLARRDLANAKRAMTAQENVVNEAARTLNILLGLYPNTQATRKTYADEKLPTLLSNLDAGIPSSVLSQRPDLLASAIRLEAAGLQVKAAKKNLLPSISLTGSGGTSSTELSDLLDTDFSVWSVLGNLSYPLLNRQVLKANVTLAENSVERLTYTYANQVLNAFNEVESGLDGENSLRQQLLDLTQARDYAFAASKRAKKSYEIGLIDANTLLSTELQLLTAEQNLINTKNFLLQNRINLILALGGGLKPASINSAAANANSALTAQSAVETQ